MENKVLPEKLMNSVLGKLYDLLTNGDDVAPASNDNYLAWLSVGMPYPKEELEFLSTGLTGVIRQSESAEEPEESDNSKESEDIEEEKTSEDINRLLSQDISRKYMQAENLARLCDMLPDTSNIKSGVTINVWNPENTLSQAYEHILKFSQVSYQELDDKTKATLKRLRGLLQEKIVKKDIITGEEKEVLQPSPLVKLYNQKKQAFISAALEYNSHRINALAGNDPAAVQFWSINASILRNNVTAAKNDWITNGYKNEYEQIAAYIAQVEGRSMVALKQEYIDDLAKARLTGMSSGSDFYYTSLIPGGFAETDNGWTEFSFRSSDYESHYDYSSKSGGGSAGLSLGFFSIGGGGSYEKTNMSNKIDSSNFQLSFKICQVPIVRPWYNVNYLISKYWRFAKDNPEFKDNMVSDGGTPPEGMIPAYPTTALFIKDLRLHFGESNSEIKGEIEKAGGGGVVSFGPFALGGSYKSSDRHRDVESDYDGQGISIKGMQLIGFKCHVLPKSPDPNPDIKEWA